MWEEVGNQSTEESTVSPEGGIVQDAGAGDQSTEAVVPSTTDVPSAYELDGKAYTGDELRSLRDNGLMQADYTRKTQELAQMRDGLQPLQQFRQVLESDPALRQHIQGYFDNQNQGQVRDEDGFEQRPNPEIQNLNQQMGSMQRSLDMVGQWASDQQLQSEMDGLVSQYSEKYPGVDRNFMLNEVLPYCSANRLMGQGQLEIGLRAMLVDKAREAGEQGMKERQNKRGQASAVRPSGGGKIPAKQNLDFNNVSYEDIVENLVKSPDVLGDY